MTGRYLPALAGAIAKMIQTSPVRTTYPCRQHGKLATEMMLLHIWCYCYFFFKYGAIAIFNNQLLPNICIILVVYMDSYTHIQSIDDCWFCCLLWHTIYYTALVLIAPPPRIILCASYLQSSEFHHACLERLGLSAAFMDESLFTAHLLQTITALVREESPENEPIGHSSGGSIIGDADGDCV